MPDFQNQGNKNLKVDPITLSPQKCQYFTIIFTGSEKYYMLIKNKLLPIFAY